VKGTEIDIVPKQAQLSKFPGVRLYSYFCSKAFKTAYKDLKANKIKHGGTKIF